MKKILILLPVATLLGGCVRFTVNQYDRSYDPETGNLVREVVTKPAATTFFAGSSALANWKASQTDKTQTASVGALSQEAGAATNGLLEAVIGAVVRAAVRP